MSRPPQEGEGFAASVAQQHPGGEPGRRKEVGDAASSRLHPPHLDENAEEGELGSPSLPANAHGSDAVSSKEQDRGIDDESMYDRRPAENKDTPPSETGGA